MQGKVLMARHFLYGWRTVFVASAVIAAAALFVFDSGENASAQGKVDKQLRSEALPNFDLRLEKTGVEMLAAFRSRQGKSLAEVSDIRQTMVIGEQSLR